MVMIATLNHFLFVICAGLGRLDVLGFFVPHTEPVIGAEKVDAGLEGTTKTSCYFRMRRRVEAMALSI